MANRLRLALIMTLFLIIFCVVGTPASAYEITANSKTQVVQIKNINKDEALPLMLFPEYAAEAVISEAKFKGIPVKRTKRSISTEISAHAALLVGPNIKIYRNGWRYTHDIADPMDIEMYKTELWVYLLD